MAMYGYGDPYFDPYGGMPDPMYPEPYPPPGFGGMPPGYGGMPPPPMFPPEPMYPPAPMYPPTPMYPPAAPGPPPRPPPPPLVALESAPVDYYYPARYNGGPGGPPPGPPGPRPFPVPPMLHMGPGQASRARQMQGPPMAMAPMGPPPQPPRSWQTPSTLIEREFAGIVGRRKPNRVVIDEPSTDDVIILPAKKTKAPVWRKVSARRLKDL